MRASSEEVHTKHRTPSFSARGVRKFTDRIDRIARKDVFMSFMSCR